MPAAFVLSSPDVAEGATIGETYVYDGLDCRGGNVSPALAWEGAPPNVRSFALTVHDPDAPRSGGWWHWLIFNLPPALNGLVRCVGKPGLEPAGSIQGQNSYASIGYGGPCPPVGHGVHRYVFTLYALDCDDLGLHAAAAPEAVAEAIRGHALASASLTALYRR